MKPQPLLCLFLILVVVCPGYLEAEPNDEPDELPQVNFELYGYLKLDASFDSSRTALGNFVKWVEPQLDKSGDAAFTMTSNESRLGVRISPKSEKDDTFKLSARIEADFYGGGAENRPHPMLRHAYMEAHSEILHLKIIAGQTSDIISPLNPNTLNYPVAWWAGNIGYRRPQIRVTKLFPQPEGGHLEAAFALTRAIGEPNDFTQIDCGADSGLPALQARLGWSGPGAHSKSPSFGVSGHWGREKVDPSKSSSAAASANFESWSMNLDYQQPLSPKLTVKSELFTGSNLSFYLGGIGQGLNLERMVEIGSRGGWVSTELGPYDHLRFNLGVSADDVEDDDIESGGRSLNRSVFLNGFYSINQSFEAAVEVTHWKTDYKDGDPAEAFRIQFATYFRF